MFEKFLEDYFIPASIYLLGKGNIGSFFSKALSELLFYLSLSGLYKKLTNIAEVMILITMHYGHSLEAAIIGFVLYLNI